MKQFIISYSVNSSRRDRRFLCALDVDDPDHVSRKRMTNKSLCSTFILRAGRDANLVQFVAQSNKKCRQEEFCNCNEQSSDLVGWAEQAEQWRVCPHHDSLTMQR